VFKNEYSDLKEWELKKLTDEYNRKKEDLIKAEKRRKEKSNDVVGSVLTTFFIFLLDKYGCGGLLNKILLLQNIIKKASGRISINGVKELCSSMNIQILKKGNLKG